ncbi:sensor histidine kinase [Allosphingosinicella flava]|uniref:Sensor histidine kinase n=1 Tax=Allosphingosinicella flava TaxID=2771430 RepID=A0A7T2GJU0_9SPHN|nr:sensor histidine kinase [Sphingosinicella flava]QPQ55082.1 sensor histidine kinase [Sphingosinicella flava]
MELVLPRHRNWFLATAFLIWMIVGWPDLREVLRPNFATETGPSPWWTMAFLAFGASLLLWAHLPPSRFRSWTLVAIQFGAALVMAVTDASAISAGLMVITSWQVATLTSANRAVGLAVAQALTFLFVWRAWICAEYSLTLGLCSGLSLFAVFAASAMRREAEAGHKLAAANAELRAMQALLAENARIAERTRISRELHDAWGHELTALALQLEVASHILPEGDGLQKVRSAKDLSRALLGRVRDVVGTLRETEVTGLRAALAQLAHGIPRPRIHVDFPEELESHAASHAHVILRCAQEAITNAARHADAENLWLELRWDGKGVCLIARDDGRGTISAPAFGNGLHGMRERLEAQGGGMKVTSGTGPGFVIEAWLPAKGVNAA